MELYIDTTKSGLIELRILEGRQVVFKSEKQTVKVSESLLSEIEKLLKKHKLKLLQFSKISVNPGPGGFSATRSGVATANALICALGLEGLVLPRYDQEPHITIPRKK